MTLQDGDSNTSLYGIIDNYLDMKDSKKTSRISATKTSSLQEL